jgi:hypothetical protein
MNLPTRWHVLSVVTTPAVEVRMTDIGYDTTGMRMSAGGCEDAADAADHTATAFSRIAISSAMFGRVPAASVLSAALDGARDRQGRTAAAEAISRADLARRLRSAADQGDGLTTATTRIATRGGPGMIVAAMQRGPSDSL